MRYARILQRLDMNILTQATAEIKVKKMLALNYKNKNSYKTINFLLK